MVLDPIPQSLPVHFFGSRPQPPTSPRTLPTRGTWGRGCRTVPKRLVWGNLVTTTKDGKEKNIGAHILMGLVLVHANASKHTCAYTRPCTCTYIYTHSLWLSCVSPHDLPPPSSPPNTQIHTLTHTLSLTRTHSLTHTHCFSLARTCSLSLSPSHTRDPTSSHIYTFMHMHTHVVVLS